MKRKVHAKSGDVKVAKDINILGDRMDFRIVAVFCLYADCIIMKTFVLEDRFISDDYGHNDLLTFS